jgi:hypothetical protein
MEQNIYRISNELAIKWLHCNTQRQTSMEQAMADHIFSS